MLEVVIPQEQAPAFLKPVVSADLQNEQNMQVLLSSLPAM